MVRDSLLLSCFSMKLLEKPVSSTILTVSLSFWAFRIHLMFPWTAISFSMWIFSLLSLRCYVDLLESSSSLNPVSLDVSRDLDQLEIRLSLSFLSMYQLNPLQLWSRGVIDRPRALGLIFGLKVQFRISSVSIRSFSLDAHSSLFDWSVWFHSYIQALSLPFFFLYFELNLFELG